MSESNNQGVAGGRCGQQWQPKAKCSKCGELFEKRGLPVHERSCDGTGRRRRSKSRAGKHRRRSVPRRGVAGRAASTKCPANLYCPRCGLNVGDVMTVLGAMSSLRKEHGI